MQNAKEQMDLFGEKNGPSIIIEFPDIYKNNYNAAKNRGVKIRFITEITKDNLHYCKQVMQIVTEMRHMESMVGGIAVTEKEYMTTTTLKNKQLLTQVFYSNAFEVVKQGQYIFDTFWEKAIPAEQRIKEIEEGIEPVKSIVLYDAQNIFNILADFYKKSDFIKLCFPIEGINVIYSNFLDLHQEVLQRYRQGKHKGIRCITSLKNKKDIELVKSYLDKGVSVRHVKDQITNNFALSDKSFLFSIEKIGEEGKMVNNILSSNDRL